MINTKIDNRDKEIHEYKEKVANTIAIVPMTL